MAYRQDEDLKFLRELESEKLNDLVYCLTHDKDGEARYTEGLSSCDKYQVFHPDHNKYWKDIAESVQRFGGNTIVNVVRGEGVLYREILMDVCKKLKVNFNNNSSTHFIEDSLLRTILEKSLHEMSEEDLRKMAEEVGIKDYSNLSKGALMTSFLAVFSAGGFMSYQLTVIIANAILQVIIGRGLTLAANATLTRTMSILTGPIGWIIAGIWTAIDIAGPAFRVTLPAVINIAVLRQGYMLEKNKN